jgi:glycosyltransferase involved in cell wall biosynthesis
MYPQPEPLSPANWSGTPRGLADGLTAHGIEVVPVGTKMPRIIQKAVGAVSQAGSLLAGNKRGALDEHSRIREACRNLSLSRALSAAGTLDAIIAMGMDLYDLGAVRPSTVPVATFDDGTLLQMWRNPDSDIRHAGFPDQEVARWFRRQARSIRSASVCCVSTSWAAKSLIQDYDVRPDTVRVVGMGHRPRRSMSSLGKDWTNPRYLFVGVDWRRKNGDQVVRAFREVRATFPNATLDIVGQHPPIHEDGVTDHGCLAREDRASQAILDALFAKATAFVLPSRFDPSPIAYLEAASAGLPVVVTTEGGAGELLGPAAISVHPDDLKGLVVALTTLTDPNISASMGEMAARRAASSKWRDVSGRIVRELGLSLPTFADVKPNAQGLIGF